MLRFLTFVQFSILVSCGSGLHSSITKMNPQSIENGYVEMLPAARIAALKEMMPGIFDQKAHEILHDEKTIWYDATAVIPGYQDSMGNPVGMRPNTIESILINLAVPGGWETLFANRGRFNFPFGTGGADRSTNLGKVNFWHVPRGDNGILPVVYWRMNFSRWRWIFPVGTIIGEVLMVRMSNGEEVVFEVRTRERTLSGWDNAVYRPFLTSTSLARAIKSKRPNWQGSQSLTLAIQHLESVDNLRSYSLSTQHYRGAFAAQSGYLDFIPSLGDPLLSMELLRDSVFQKVRPGITWKSNGAANSFAPSTQSPDGLTPINYDGGMLSVDNASCNRCHDQAGRQIGDFHGDLVLYGELWGEDEIFSWHPFENSSFVDSQGNVKNFNNDNRRLRSDLQQAQLIVPLDRSRHPESLYKEIPRNWTYRPVVNASQQ